MSEGFSPYYDATRDRPPRPTLLKALDLFRGAAGLAVDLGCGEGRDTVELLRRDWRVLAIDAEDEAIRRLQARGLAPAAKLETVVARFEDAAWPLCQLVNASFALPLVAPDHFPALWAKIVASLEPGGRFAGQLYGLRDDWAGRPGVTTHDRPAIERLLEGFATELLDEEESDAVTPRGQPKHWHIFHVVARKL